MGVEITQSVGDRMRGIKNEPHFKERMGNVEERQDEFVSLLAQNMTEINKRIPVGASWAYQQLPQSKLSPPASFTWQDAPINIYKNGVGQIFTDFNVSDYEITGKTYYVDIVNGLDTNDGLTSGTALKRVQDALDKPDIDVLIIAEGVYGNNTGLSFVTAEVKRSCSIKAAQGAKVVLSQHKVGLVYTLTAGKTKTYQVARANIGRIFDASNTDADGDNIELTKRLSIDEVESNPNSWYTDGTTIYVHTFNDRAPDSNIRLYFNNITCLNVKAGLTVYLEGIDFEGGTTVIYGNTNSNIYAKDCSFKYSTSVDAIYMQGAASVSAYQNCVVAKNYEDGFNYTTGSKGIEVNCIGRDNGDITKSDSCNGSTGHWGSKIIRVNGQYFRNKGSNVGDTQPDTQSWNIGCISHTSLAVAEARYKSNFTAHGDGEMWIESGVSYNSLNANTVQDNATIHLKDCAFIGNTTIEGTGKVLSY